MIIGQIPGATRKIGEAQGYSALPVQDVLLHDEAQDKRTPAMRTLWHFSEEDKRRVLSGGAIRLTILGSAHPPILLEVLSEEEVSPIPG